jgi:hypothetical protein
MYSEISFHLNHPSEPITPQDIGRFVIQQRTGYDRLTKRRTDKGGRTEMCRRVLCIPTEQDEILLMLLFLSIVLCKT